MKRDWLNRPRKMVPCKIVLDGEVFEEQLHPLDDASVRSGEAAFTVLDTDTPEEGAAKTELRGYFYAAVGLGYDNFLARDPSEMAQELKAAPNCPTAANVVLMVNALVDRYTLTVQKIEEEAKAAIRPTESAG